MGKIFAPGPITIMLCYYVTLLLQSASLSAALPICLGVKYHSGGAHDDCFALPRENVV